MYVFFMRHGEAFPQAQSDIDRELQDSGRNDITAIIERCQQEPNFTDQIDEIWCSFYIRAQQTANIVGNMINKPVHVQTGLAPTDNPDLLLEQIRNADKTVLVVTHQPLIGTIVDRLAGLETGRYRMGTSALAAVQTDVMAYGCGELLWLHQP